MSSDSWKPIKLNQIGFVGRGKSRNRPRNAPSLYGGNYPFVQTSDIKSAGLYLREYSQTYNEKGLAQSKLWEPGTLCITIAANIAETAILGIKACFPDSVVGFIADPQKSDVRFVKYYIDTIKLQMQNISRGTTQDNLSLDKLLTFDILTPPLSIQQRIADILSAYDDLIENNTRRIRILEEMAQMIYREWFVCFRFPGHEGVKMVETDLGLIPEGWKVVSVRDVTHYINRGVSPKYDDNVSMIVINQKCIRDNKMNLDLARNHNTKVAVEKYIKFGDVLINSTGIGTLGRVAQVYQPIDNCTVDSHVTIVRPNDNVNLDYFGFYLLSLQAYFDSQGIGATGQTELSRDTITKVKLFLPAIQVQNEFSALISPMRKMMIVLNIQNTKLRQTRDLLLSRLMSGELDVSNMEAQNE